MGKRRRMAQQAANNAVLLEAPKEDRANALAIVEHSIEKYKPKTYQTVTNTPNYATDRKVIKAHELRQMLKDNEPKGYVIGAKIRTNYGIVGTICAYRDIPDSMEISVYGKDGVPCLYKISRDDGIVQTNITYSTQELTLIGEQ